MISPAERLPLTLVLYPDPALTTPCSPVTEFDASLGETLDAMRVIMIDSKGIGLAANQVGVPKAFFIMQDLKGKIWEFINPKIIEQEGVQYQQEGCLSFPGVYVQVPRPGQLTLLAQDRNGEEFRVVMEGVEAICADHEINHLQGIVFVSKVSRQVRRRLGY